MNEQFNLSTSEGFNKAFESFTYLKSIGATVEIKHVKQTRSSRQNAALHLYFTFCSNALNESGIEFCYRGLKGMDIEIPWNGELFKTMIWKPIQITLFEFESTTKLKTSEINQILDVLTRHFASIGLQINFPNQFDYFLDKVYK
jgi:hypothetical protein